MDWIQAQRALSDKDLTIFNAELQRRSKSTGFAYVLWFLLGGAGVHHFYIGKVHRGLLYLVLGVFGWFFFLAGLVAGEFPSGSTDAMAGTTILGILALGLLGLFLLWDLFTIPRQIALREQGIKQELLAQLGAIDQDVTHLGANNDGSVWIFVFLPSLITVGILFFLLQERHTRYTTETEKKETVQVPSETRGTTVTLTPSREIYVNRKRVTEEGLEPALKEALSASRDKIVILKGNRDVLLKEAVKIVSIAKRAGASEIAIAAQAERTKK